ncbi:MAG: tRNA pseudouridine(38-40) synthase TruA [Candidatus Aureabacteria bacterium]|nr:tRNA pseudouridine(38-40) synthase TruA [Candidatus Auribacterota bacterium]
MLIIEYDGLLFSGWQTQKNAPTVQRAIEKTLEKILSHKVRIFGSGRTDAGVHAKAQTANFFTNNDLSCRKIQKALNSWLPDGISVKKVSEADGNFHSRYSAKLKHYRYVILNGRTPPALERNRVWFIPYPLETVDMRKAAKYLLGRHDFSSFGVNSRSKVDNPVRTIYSIEIQKRGSKIQFDITGDGFLYKMVRSIIGTLVDVGRGKRNADEIKTILSAKSRIGASPIAPPQGLYLYRVIY